jgi:folate-dependent phosphoribosylglycinamide formyltransferase PurN
MTVRRSGKLSVVVLTSIPLGVEVAAALRRRPEVGRLTLLTAPAAPGKSVASLIRDTLRYEGVPGLLTAVIRRLRKAVGLHDGMPLAVLARGCPDVPHYALDRFHSETCLARMRTVAPDLGVVVGTHILRSDLYSIPRLGCINLHLGAAPDFRGSSPAFYEMLEAVPEVGVTIHRVTDTLDGGNILLQERCPLEIAPEGDPILYLRRYVADVLCPNGVRLMAEAVAAIAQGTHVETAQDPRRAHTNRRATWALKCELRRRVAGRRAPVPPFPATRLTYGATKP